MSGSSHGSGMGLSGGATGGHGSPDRSRSPRPGPAAGLARGGTCSGPAPAPCTPGTLGVRRHTTCRGTTPGSLTLATSGSSDTTHGGAGASGDTDGAACHAGIRVAGSNRKWLGDCSCPVVSTASTTCGSRRGEGGRSGGGGGTKQPSVSSAHPTIRGIPGHAGVAGSELGCATARAARDRPPAHRCGQSDEERQLGAGASDRQSSRLHCVCPACPRFVHRSSVSIAVTLGCPGGGSTRADGTAAALVRGTIFPLPLI